MNVRSVKLKNGSLLIVVNIPQNPSMTTMALVKSGPHFDPPNKTGLSHFVEHMLYKGTKKWPTSLELTSVLEKKGASFFTFSYHETNRYWIKSSVDDIELAVDNLLERLNHSLILEKDIKTEKEVVKEELRIIKGNPEKLIWELWSQTVWQGSPQGRIYIGDEETINSFSGDDVNNFMRMNYISDKIVFAVSGDAPPEKIIESFNTQLSPLNNVINNSDLPNARDKNKITLKIFKNTNLETLTVALGFPTTYFGHEDTAVLELIETILGGGMSSRLRHKIMESGYTYSIEACTEHLSNGGYFLILFTTTKKNLNRVLKIILNEISNISHNLIKAEELSLAKGFLSGSLRVNMETSFDWAKWFTDQYLLSSDKILTLEEKISRINEIDAGEIKRISQKYFKPQNLCLSIIGNVEEEEIFFEFINFRL